MSGLSMDQDTAQKLFSEGAVAVLLNVPPLMEVGIDLHSWNVGPKFKGIKMIPPGLHFIYYSAVSRQGETAPRTGFFHHFKPGEVLLRVYQPHTEDFREESPEQQERVSQHLRSLDPNLGPYPLDTWRRWVALTQHITTQHLASVLPLSGMVRSVAETSSASSSNATTSHSNNSKVAPQDGCSRATDPAVSAHENGPDRHGAHDAGPLSNHGDVDCLNILNAPPGSHDGKEESKSSTEDRLSYERLAMATVSPTEESLQHRAAAGVLRASSSPDTDLSSNDVNASSTAATATCSGSVADVTSSMAAEASSNDANASSSSSTGVAAADSSVADAASSSVAAGASSIPGTEWRWFEPPKRPYRAGASPAQVTAAALDSSYLLSCLVDTLSSPQEVLSEVQLSFLVFVVGQSWAGWQRWRQLLDLLCRAEQAVVQQPDLYSKLIAVLHYQIQEVPSDLFVDIVEQENFLASSLTTLFANIDDNSSALPPALVTRANSFRSHLSAKFDWNFDLEEDEECAPVVVVV